MVYAFQVLHSYYFLNTYRFYSTVYMNSPKRANFSDNDILALLEILITMIQLILRNDACKMLK